MSSAATKPVGIDEARKRFVERVLAKRADMPAEGGLMTLRAAALEAAHRSYLPTRNDEAWRFTDPSALYQLAFAPAPVLACPSVEAIAPFVLPEAEQRLVFADGAFVPSLSTTVATERLFIGSLAEALVHPSFPTDSVRSNLGRIADFKARTFSALNTAVLRDAAVIIIPRDVVLDAPVHVLFVSTVAEAAIQPRLLVITEAGARGTIIEDHVALHGGEYFSNVVTELGVGAGSTLRHVRLQRESTRAFHVAECAVRVDRDARYISHSIALGARWSRLDLNVTQAGSGAAIESSGLALINDRQLADTHSCFDHAGPDGVSRQLHKAVVAGQAHAVFNGRILVREGAQRTDSAQQSRTLLLSRRAHVDTKPQLEIFADDVKCAHGATVGQLEADELFYLRSRGLGETAARNLLTYAFAAEVVDGLGVPSLVARLRQLVLERTETKEAS